MFRIGQSSDIHAFCEGDTLILGGVSIPYNKGVLAHSDGDALCHAVAESILGALALKDLGHHFPDTDPKYKGMCSLSIVEEVYKLMCTKGYKIQNIDALIMIEKPKMAPYIQQMITNVARVLHCSETQVNIKATRGEKIGFVGREEGVLAQCVCLLIKDEKSTQNIEEVV